MQTWLRTLVAATAFAGFMPAVHAGEYVWLEGESGKSNVKVNNAGWGNAAYLSGEKWMSISIEPKDVDAGVPAEGVLLAYPFEIKKGAKYEVWARTGYENVRSPFEYRIDSGEWTKIPRELLTTDLMEIDFFCEVAWLKLGDAQLAPGPHTLHLRVGKTRDKAGKAERILFANDVICLNEGEFHPNAKFKPDETGRDEKDEAAARSVFKLPEASGDQRASVSLKGVWEIARDDEQSPGEVAEPIKSLPKHAIFRAIQVPSDKNVSRKDLVFAHRVWYRTRVDVPARLADRSFFIDFPLNNLNTTVYVNGVYCGFEKNPFCNFQIDVTKGIKPGQTNEVWVGIRDAWYGRSANPDDPLKLRRTFNTPLKFFSEGFQQLDYPIWNCPQSGILCGPTFVAAGKVYASDVFVKPSVEKKQLAADVTLTNNAAEDASGEVRWEAIEEPGGAVARRFASRPFQVPAGKTQTIAVTDGWADPKLWWPDTPSMYRLRTTLVVAGKVVDVKETTFGFREWKTVGTKLTLNGVTWHIWADLIGDTGLTADSWLKAYKAANERLTRFVTAGQGGHDPHWYGMEPQQALDFMDRNGVVVRRNTTLDGETIGTAFNEEDPAIRKRQGGSDIKQTLMKNWSDQCVAQVRGERNHPSIAIWSIENEFAFINLINLLGNSPKMDKYEQEIAKAANAVMQADPTRTVMIDGGGALKENLLPVHGDHYVAAMGPEYPDRAYEPYVEGGGRGRWKWDMKRPRFIGEEFYATGINPANYSIVGGEVCFQGKAATKDAVATMYRMLQEGYRWGGYYAGWHFWLGGEGGERQRVANAPRAVLVRQWDWSFGSGQTVTRTFGIFNDTQYEEPLTFARVLTLGGNEVYKRTSDHRVRPGTAEKFDEQIALPQVKARQEGQLVLTLSAGEKVLFRDVKAVSVLPPAAAGLALAADAVAVYDPKGLLAEPLKSAGIAYTALKNLRNLPESAKVLVIGPDAISATETTGTELAAYAATGKAVLVLDQDSPLKYQAIPAELEPAPTSFNDEFGQDRPAGSGRIAFIEDVSHPLFKGLKDRDFFTWAGDHVVYRNAYNKPTRAAKSLMQAGPRLSQSVMVEVPVGKGVMYLSQLDMSHKLATNGAARQLLANMVTWGAQYKQEFANVVASLQDEQFAKAIDGIGLRYTKAADALSALSDADKRIALITASPENLKLLAANMDKVRAFWNRGGHIFFAGLTPEGLADYNRIVGYEHVIRPFFRERVTFPPVKNPLTSGLNSGDIVMLSGKRIFGWTADEYVASDVFSYVIDYDEIAPFGKSNFGSYANITNGFFSSDGWPLTIDFPAPPDGKPFDIKIDLPREETITELIYKPSTKYNATTRIGLVFDGGDRAAYKIEPNNEVQTIAVAPHKARTLTLQILDFQLDPAKAKLIGIDNIWIKVKRSEDFYQNVRPLLNSGGLMQYIKGPGGVVLCNIKFQEHEAVAVNKDKKRAILAALLRNLKAPFAGGHTVIASEKMLSYAPVDIHTRATAYKGDTGSFFGDRKHTFHALPEGRQILQGVAYEIYEMPTSPVPQVLMLDGPGVPGKLPRAINDIAVNAKSDALFFLHAGKIVVRMNEGERREKKKFVLFKYVVNYEDGQKVEIPIYSEIDIDNYVQTEPKALPGGQVAWVGAYEGSHDKAVAYSKQWNNPRPDVAIKSVDMIGVDEKRGAAVLLALTAAKVK